MQNNTSFLAAVVQTRPAYDLDKNLQQAFALVEEACHSGARLVVLPENFAHFGQKNFAEIGRLERDPHGPVRRFLSDLAARNKIWLLGGSLPVAMRDDEPRPAARSILFDPNGLEIAGYSKIHLFDVEVEHSAGDPVTSYIESADFAPGNEQVVVETELCCLGLTICYDLRFAELYRGLCDRGAEVIAVPSAFTAATGKDHWELLLRARAVENQIFVLGANQVDRQHPKRGLWGGSAIIDPWGNVLASIADEPGIALAEIDLSLIDRINRKMPINRHRRL